VLIGLAGAALFYGDGMITGWGPPENRGSHLTRRWRRQDSNPRSTERQARSETRALRRMLSDSEVDSKVKGRTI
jgi:hypothetical protein